MFVDSIVSKETINIRQVRTVPQWCTCGTVSEETINITQVRTVVYMWYLWYSGVHVVPMVAQWYIIMVIIIAGTLF